MPCSYYLPGEEAALARTEARTQRDEYKRLLDEATHELDVLREAILATVGEGKTFPQVLLRDIYVKQVEHRKMDLERLTATFTDENGRARKGYGDLMKKVRKADPAKPLEPQLGFDPDEY